MSKESNYTLGDLITLQRGFDITRSEQTYGPYPVVSSSGITSYHHEYKTKGPGVVIGRKGTLGTAFYIDKDFWPHDTTLWVKDFKGNDPYYVYCLLSLLHLEQLDTGSANPTLNRNYAHQIPIREVSFDTQKNISKVICSIDSKISNNASICSELEAMAKTLYDYWFVQFDFPDENGKPYRASGGEMVWNEQLKREIPRGWTAKSLSEICKFRNGINYEKDCLGDYTYRIANVRNITASSFLMDVSDFDEIMLPKEQGNRYVLSKNDIIIARSGTPGATRLVIDPSNNVIFCGFIICCTPSNSKHRLYLTHFLKQLEGTNATKTGGSILQNVSQDTLKSLQVALPNDFVLDRFNKKIEPLVQMMQNIIDENRALIQLRDWLLPMLMNGQARVE